MQLIFYFFKFFFTDLAVLLPPIELERPWDILSIHLEKNGSWTLTMGMKRYWEAKPMAGATGRRSVSLITRRSMAQPMLMYATITNKMITWMKILSNTRWPRCTWNGWWLCPLSSTLLFLKVIIMKPQNKFGILTRCVLTIFVKAGCHISLPFWLLLLSRNLTSQFLLPVPLNFQFSFIITLGSTPWWSEPLNIPSPAFVFHTSCHNYISSTAIWGSSSWSKLWETTAWERQLKFKNFWGAIPTYEIQWKVK